MLDALQFETEIKGGAIKTLTEIQELLGKISQKTTITIDVQGVQDFQKFVQSNDFKDVAKNISSAFGGAKAKNVEAFFTNLRTEIEKVKTSLKSDDYSAFMNQIGLLTQKFNDLSTAYQSFLKASGSKTGDDVITNIEQRLRSVEKTIAQLEPAYKKLQKKQENLENQTAKLAKKQEELHNKMKKNTEEADKQSVAMDGLQKMMNKFLSVYAIGRFASEMAQITGELELQKRSLEVIIGNADKANELYSTIRDMSQMSPYTFQDLMKSTRQLSAFGIETRDLYDTMKALSDIGAGLSVDVQRLILAYGHTRSYGYLSGIQNRQFETAGIDMIGGLVDYYNKLADAEERAGRSADRVTRKDVFKKMSKRDISFEDVNAVIMDLDREGGKFFNMQERQFETLGGQLRNLRNNYNIMMSEMGEQNKGILRAGVNLLNELTGHWDKYAVVIKSLIAPLLSLRIAMIAVNRASNEGVSLFSATGAAKVKDGLKSMMASFKSFFTSIGGWATIALAAVSALLIHIRDMNKEAERLAKNMAESADRSAAEIDRILEKYNGGVISITPTKSTINGNEVTSNEISFNREAMKNLNLGYELEELKRKLQAMSPFYEGDLVDIFKLKSQEEQFEAMIKTMESYRKADDILAANERRFAESGKGDWWTKGTESFAQNAKQYAESVNLIGDRLQRMRNEERLSAAMLTKFNEELNGVLGQGDDASRTEKLRNYFVSTLSMSEDTRQALVDSWSDGLKSAYNEALNIFAYRNDGGHKTTIRDAFRMMFGMNAIPRKQDLSYNMDKDAEALKASLESESDYKTRLASIRTNFTSWTQDAKLPADVARSLFEDLLQDVSSRLGNNDYNQYMQTEFQNEFGKRMETMVKNNPNWTKDEAANAAEEVVDDIMDDWEKAGRVLAYNFWDKGFMDELKTSAGNMAPVRQAWQRMLQDATTDEQTGKTTYSDFYNKFANQIRNAVETDNLGTFMGETIKKQFDDSAKELGEELKPLITKRGVNISPDMQLKSSNLDELLKAQKEINSRYENFQKGGENRMVKDFAYGESLKNAKDLLDALILIIQKGNELGFKYGEDKKSGYGSGYHDEYAKRWDERIRIMKEAYDWYDKWEKKVGESEAFKKVDERYRDIFDEWKTDKILPFDFQATDIKDYFSYVEQIRDQALAKYQKQKNDESKNNGQEALRVYRQAVAVLEEGGYDNFIRAAEKFQSIMEKTMDDLQRRWSLFTDIRDKTGNVGLAASLSGVDTSFRTQADAMRAAVQNAYTEAGGEGEVNFDISLDKDAVRAMFEGAIRGDKTDAKYMESIDGLIKGFEEWQKSEQEQEQADINITVDLMASAVDVQSETQRIMADYNRQYNALNRIFPNGGPEFDQANNILAANTNAKIVQAQQSYKFLMDGVTTMNIKAAKQIKKDYEDALLKQLKSGAITAKQYADEIQNINDKMRELENTPSYFRSFTQNGLQGVFENMQQRGKGDTERGGAMLQDAERMYRDADMLLQKYEGTGNAKGMREAADMFNNAKAAEAIGKNMLASGAAKMKGGAGALQTLAMIDAIINGINKMVQSLKNFADYIKQVNVALGRADADEWTRRDTALYAFSNASQQATNGWNSLKEGDIIGALQGTYGSWAEWWKSIAEGDDKEREYQIKLSERELKILSNMESRLDKIAERTLGYGGEVDDATWDKFRANIDEWNKAQNGETYYTGTAMQKSIWGVIGNALLPVIGGRAAESIYDKNQTKNYSSVYSSKTIAAMQSALQTGSLYGAQYAAKMMERDELTAQLKQLEAENNKDNDRIKETEQKLWDVKQDLAYFAEDLAKELWGIDLKGWADQIGDALMNAFVNGENAAKAFDDTMRSIMQNVVNEILKVGLVEPMIADLRKTLFGTQNENGEFVGGKVSMSDITKDPLAAGKLIAQVVNDWRQSEGQSLVLAYQEAVSGINAGMNGYLMNQNTNTLSSNIQGTTEKTSDLLAGYLAAIMQDRASERVVMETFVNEAWPQFVQDVKMTDITSSLDAVNTNLGYILYAMTGSSENGNGMGGMVGQLEDIYNILNGMKNGTVQVQMR